MCELITPQAQLHTKEDQNMFNPYPSKRDENSIDYIDGKAVVNKKCYLAAGRMKVINGEIFVIDNNNQLHDLRPKEAAVWNSCTHSVMEEERLIDKVVSYGKKFGLYYTDSDLERILDRLVNEKLLFFGTGTNTEFATINILSQVVFRRKRGILSSSVFTFRRFMKLKGISFGKKFYVAILNTLKNLLVGCHSLSRRLRKSAKDGKNGFQMFLEVQNEYEYSLIFEAFNELLLYEYIEEYGIDAFNS